MHSNEVTLTACEFYDWISVYDIAVEYLIS